jgi:hypothetical protein
VGFDATGGPLGSDAPDDSPASDGIDAPPNAMTLTFGEAPLTMIKNVTRDTYLSNEVGEALFNFGGDSEVRIELDVDERALLAFDLTAIPVTATILDADLAGTLLQIPLAPSAIHLHRVLEPWDEGIQSGAGGAANHVMRTATTAWMTPGAGPPLSASSTAVASFLPILGSQTMDLPNDVITLWVQNPGTNHGFVLISTNDDSTRITTSEGTPSSARPVLTVTFVP